MLLIIFFLILLQTVAPIETYTVYTSYQELIQQWKKVVPIRWQHEASEIALTQ